MLGRRLEIAKHKANQAVKRELSWVNHIPEDQRDHYTGILRKTKKRCSCWMCCNARKMEGPTMQEKRQMINDEYEE